MQNSIWCNLHTRLDAYRNHGWNCGRGLWPTQETVETLGKTLQGFYHIGEEQSAYWVGWQRMLPTFVLCPCGTPTSSELEDSVWNIQAEWATQWDFVSMSLFEGVGGGGWHRNWLIDTWTLAAFFTECPIEWWPFGISCHFFFLGFLTPI